ncbi:MAG: histidine kinase [Parafilimonas sp.]
MKIKCRQHEMILVTAIALMITISHAWIILHLSQQKINMQYANVFKEMNVPFNLYRNVILPDIAVFVLTYLAYLFVNLYTVPRFLFPKKFEAGTSKITLAFPKISFQGLSKKVLKKYAWLLIQIILIVLILGTAYDTATYFRHEWQFHYPGFSIFFNPNIPNSQLSLAVGFFAAASILVLYGLYVCVREFIIGLIEGSRQREFNISVFNKATTFLLIIFLITVFLLAFNMEGQQEPFESYVLIISALFAMFISNVYWLFPMTGENSFFSSKIIIRLLSTSFVYTMPLIVLVHAEAPAAFLFTWALQLFIVTPLTWWYYQSNKEKILRLRVVEKQLVKSKADLQFLRSQINPHFLFNILNTLYGTALQENAERTAEGIQKLGDMMRFMLHENNLDFIQMDKEIEYLKNYIALQKLRTQSSPEIIIEDNISELNCNHKIAPMLLIPLVENAFKHGISLKEKSWIKINLECTEKEILFEVYNSMHVKDENDPEKERSGIGLKNVMERLKLIYGSRFQISVNGDGKEFFVKLAIQP